MESTPRMEFTASFSRSANVSWMTSVSSSGWSTCAAIGSSSSSSSSSSSWYGRTATGWVDRDAVKVRRSGSRKPSERDASYMSTAASRLASAGPRRTGPRGSPVVTSTRLREGRSSHHMTSSGETPMRSAAAVSRACEWTRYRASAHSDTRCGVGEYTCAIFRYRLVVGPDAAPTCGAPPGAVSRSFQTINYFLGTANKNIGQPTAFQLEFKNTMSV